MVDIERLRTYEVFTTEKPIQHIDETWRYPIYVVERVIKETKEVVAIDSKDHQNPRRIFTEQDLQSMYLVDSSLSHKDRMIRNARIGGTDTNSELLALGICQEIEKKHGGLSIYLKELDPELLKKTKAFLQSMLEKKTTGLSRDIS